MEKKPVNNETFDLLKDLERNVEFVLPDLQKLEIERNDRNQEFFSKLDHFYGESHKNEPSIRNVAATKIQKVFRGYMGRKHYLDVLFGKVLESENELHEQQNRQVQEGQILIESYKIERELEETDAVIRNKTRLTHTNASIIQRAWRAYRKPKHEHQCCPCNDNFPDLYEYYGETQTICFCCDEHRHLSDKERFDLLFPVDYDDTSLPESQLVATSLGWHSISSVLNGETLDTNQDDLKNSMSNGNSKIENGLDVSEINKDNKIISDTNECNTSALESMKLVDINNGGIVIENQVPETHISKLSLGQLKLLIQQLQNAVSEKNLDLLKELMIRDDLFSKHEDLLLNAEYLSKRELEKRR